MPSRYLTQEQIDKYHKDGYLIIPGLLSREETQALMDRAKLLIKNFDTNAHPLTKVMTEGETEVGDEYFLKSGDKIRFFMEEDALDSNGNLTKPKERAVNRIGHALHGLDPVFRKVTLEHERMKQVIRDLKLHHNPVVVQSMVITKQPEIGGEVSEHTDSTFVYTKPQTCFGFWFPLEKCTAENGALSFLPGSHRTVPLTKRFVSRPGGGTGFDRLVPDDAETERKINEAKEGEYVFAECEAGDGIIIHGSVLHKSEKNTSQHARFAYTFHIIDSQPHVTYDSKNWLQPTEALPFPRIDLGEKRRLCKL